MVTVNLGKLVYLWRGEYSAAETYAAYDVCRHRNDVHICTADAAAGETPASAPDKWDLMTKGAAAVASQAQAEAGSNNAAAMTPLRVAQAIAALSPGLPAGAIITSASMTAPGGYLYCNGAAISRTVYATLFAAIGTAFGAGDGSSTFNIPDLRGEFLRGWDNGRGVDDGRVFGSVQGHALGRHQHYLSNGVAHNRNEHAGGNGGSIGSSRQGSLPYNSYTTPAGGSETRPRNVAFNFYIKY